MFPFKMIWCFSLLAVGIVANAQAPIHPGHVKHLLTQAEEASASTQSLLPQKKVRRRARNFRSGNGDSVWLPKPEEVNNYTLHDLVMLNPSSYRVAANLRYRSLFVLHNDIKENLEPLIKGVKDVDENAVLVATEKLRNGVVDRPWNRRMNRALQEYMLYRGVPAHIAGRIAIATTTLRQKDSAKRNDPIYASDPEIREARRARKKESMTRCRERQKELKSKGKNVHDGIDPTFLQSLILDDKQGYRRKPSEIEKLAASKEQELGFHRSEIFMKRITVMMRKLDYSDLDIQEFVGLRTRRLQRQKRLNAAYRTIASLQADQGSSSKTGGEMSVAPGESSKSMARSLTEGEVPYREDWWHPENV